MKNVLVITYTFPPVGSGSVIRVAKFAKYLPRYGWNPIVVTADHAFLQHDESLLHEVRHVRVVRTSRSLVSTVYGSMIHRTTRVVTERGSLSATTSILYRIYRLWSALLDAALIPDRQVVWVLSALRAARSVVRHHKIDVIYTISVPHSVTIVGALIKWWYGIPWVADLRDVWTDRWHHEYKMGEWRLCIERWMERAMLRWANHVVMVTEPARVYFAQRAQPSDEDKFTIIPNGFDREDFTQIRISSRLPQGAALRFTTMGVMTRDYHYGALQRFLRSFQRLEKSQKIAPASCRVDVLSSTDPNLFRLNDSDIPVHYVGFLPHHAALQYGADSDMLFFILHPDFSGNSYPGKMFEYMALRRPILALTAEGISAAFIRDRHLGWAVDDRNDELLDATICGIYEQWRRQGALESPPLDSIVAFERSHLTKRLAAIFDRLTVE